MTALLAYVGPGAGLSFLGSLLAVVVVIAVGLLGLVIYPLKLVLGWYRGGVTQSPGESASCPPQATSV
jgi:hypothetical protein